MKRELAKGLHVGLRIVQVTKLVSILIMAITAYPAYQLILGFSSGTLPALFWIRFNPPIQLVNGAQLVIFVYIMVFGWFFTNALTRVANQYSNYFRDLTRPIWSRFDAWIASRLE